MAALQAQLARITEKKLHACAAYLQTTKQLADALTHGDMAAVERHIRRRDDLIPVMNRLDRLAGRYGGYGFRGPAGEIRIILNKIAKIDKACGETAKIRHSHLKKTITAVKGYAQKRESPPKLFNLQT
jgi:hypothetical protein